ncbi:hypothetical protein [Selenomonas ruminantium]|nr:hypothetical protein [Selenomonas ruminantium]
MKKAVAGLLLVLATFLLANTMMASTVFAQDVWVYTDKRGSEFYVKTETAQYVDSVNPNWGYMHRFYLEVTCVKVFSDGYKMKIDYQWDYDEKTGTWDGGTFSSLDDKNHPENRIIFENAKKYASRTVKRSW